MFGYTRGEMLGQPVELLVPTRLQQVHVTHRDRYFADPRTRPMGAGQALAGKRKDGSEFPVEISLSPLKTASGTLVTSIIRDITSRVQAEAKFRGLLESAPDGIVVVDSKGIIVIVNTQVERLFGYSREELIGQPVEILVPTRYKNTHIGQRNAYIRAPRTRPMGAGQALSGRKKDGTEFPVEISLSPLQTGEGTLVTSIIRDITEHRKAEEKIKASLREKEVLLKEIHHRVKNNLQVTSSLLKLQSGYITDAAAKEMFSESQNRIRSMALVHEKLYQSSDLSRINISDYAQALVDLLKRSFGSDADNIRVDVASTDVVLTVEAAVPCGLILNELISNCLKHAFIGRQQGTISVRIAHVSQQGIEIEVRDDGVGLPPNLDLEKLDSLGLRLVRNLTSQLSGKFELIGGAGTTARITFTPDDRGAEP
ncbi:MAG TPA: PAS domain S-box protein [Planctomycetota bacterium]|nr:PAS domain S-box protein [Planctomycetota bacterium]